MQHDDNFPNDNRTQQLNPEALAAEVTGFLEQVAVGELVGAKLSRLLDGFLQGEVLPQADRAAGQGIDPTPLLAITAEVLRRYADALHPPDMPSKGSAGHGRRPSPRPSPSDPSGAVPVGMDFMADPDTDNSDLLQRAEQAQAQSKALREQMARAAEAVAATEQEVARVHRRLAAEGGPLAAEAREHADRAAEVAAKERAEAERLRRPDSG